MAADPGHQSELTCGTRVLLFFLPPLSRALAIDSGLCPLGQEAHP